MLRAVLSIQNNELDKAEVHVCWFDALLLLRPNALFVGNSRRLPLLFSHLRL